MHKDKKKIWFNQKKILPDFQNDKNGYLKEKNQHISREGRETGSLRADFC